MRGPKPAKDNDVSPVCGVGVCVFAAELSASRGLVAPVVWTCTCVDVAVAVA